jgi:hypothetical protein
VSSPISRAADRVEGADGQLDDVFTTRASAARPSRRRLPRPFASPCRSLATISPKRPAAARAAAVCS